MPARNTFKPGIPNPWAVDGLWTVRNGAAGGEGRRAEQIPELPRPHCSSAVALDSPWSETPAVN